MTARLSGSDRYEADKLLALERLERSIAREENDKREAAKDYRARIDELKVARNKVLEDLEKFRAGERALPLDGEQVAAGGPKGEPGVDG